MAVSFRNDIVTIEDDGGQLTGVGTNCTSVRVYISEGTASFSAGTAGTWTGNMSGCQFEVKEDGKVKVK